MSEELPTSEQTPAPTAVPPPTQIDVLKLLASLDDGTADFKQRKEAAVVIRGMSQELTALHQRYAVLAATSRQLVAGAMNARSAAQVIDRKLVMTPHVDPVTVAAASAVVSALNAVLLPFDQALKQHKQSKG